jgi:hypothetical protein
MTIPVEPTDEVITTSGGKTATIPITPSPAHTSKINIVTKDGGDTTVTVPSYPTTQTVKTKNGGETTITEEPRSPWIITTTTSGGHHSIFTFKPETVTITTISGKKEVITTIPMSEPE